MENSVRQAVILVGGRGTRLGSLTAEIPKPLLPIRDEKRFLDYLVERTAEQGFTDILMVAGHLGGQVKARYDGASFGEARVTVVVEPSPAGTGGALRHVDDRLDAAFIMMNGDSIFDFDFRILTTIAGPGDIGALALRRVEDGRRYGAVEASEGRVLSFKEKNLAMSGPALISGGVYVLRREIMSLIDHSPCSIEAEIFPLLASSGRLACHEFQGYFIDIGLPDTLEQARRDLPIRFDG